MNLRRASHRLTLLFVSLALLAGCPKEPALQVSPERISFGTSKEDAKLTLRNIGGGTLTWTIEEVVRTSTGDYQAQDIEWLSVDLLTGDTKTEADTVRLTVTREGLAVGKYTDAALRITPNTGDPVIVPLLLEVVTTLDVGQAEVYVTAGLTETQIKVANSGQQSMSWKIWYLPDPTQPKVVTALPNGVTAAPASGTLGAGQFALVTINWPSDRTDPLYFVFDADATTPEIEDGSPTVRVGFDVPLTLVPSDSLEIFKNVSKATDVIQPVTELQIENSSSTDKVWTAAVTMANGDATESLFTVTPSSGTLATGAKATVEIVVASPNDVIDAAGNYQLLVMSGETKLTPIPINIHVESLPVIAASWPPDTSSSHPEVVAVDALNFGRDKVEMPFYVVNVGGLSSSLNYRITAAPEGEDATKPLIASVYPSESDSSGEANVFFHPDASLANTLIDATRVSVAINRDNLSKDLETRTLLIEAMDADNQAIDWKLVKPVELTLTVERAPLTLEGATNRARSPYMMRFVFTPRDGLGRAIDTWDPVKLGRLSFSVNEDELPLDMNETRMYVRGPAEVKANIALMLDFSGSMYYAGTRKATNPLQPGEALEGVRAAALGFIDDLPEGWRMALLYHNDRQQDDIVMQPFTQNRESLKATLQAFNLPPSLHAVSPIYDSMIAGIARLAAEDPGETLPFDDADLRALVVITDGQDNSSVAKSTDVDSAAKENRVRIFPLVYSAGDTVDYGPMLSIASNSGGHFFSAGDANNLPTLLENRQALTLQPAVQSNLATALFKIKNVGTATLAWTVSAREPYPWVSSVIPAGSTSPDASSQVSVDLNTTYLSTQATSAARAITVEGYIDVASDSGSGTVLLTVNVGADGVVDSIQTELRDERGQVMSDLSRQVVFTYLTPKQQDFKYLIQGAYKDDDNRTIRGAWERDGVWASGDVDASQVTLTSEGLVNDGLTGEVSATVYLRCDYASRNLYDMQVRFYPALPQDILDEAAALPAWVGNAPFPENAIEEFRQIDIAQDLTVEIAEDGLLSGGTFSESPWLLHPSDDGIYYALDQQNSPLPYGVSGNLLKVTLRGAHLTRFVEIMEAQSRDPEILLGMRVNNDIYRSPAAPGQPLATHYVVYPGGQSFLGKFLSVTRKPSLAAPGRSLSDLRIPSATLGLAEPWDFDEDGLPDFNDPYLDDNARPGSMVVPNPADLTVQTTTVSNFTLSVRNNRLDRFTFALDPLALPTWCTGVNIAPLDGVLLPDYSGNSTLPQHRGTIQITVDTTGLSARTYPVEFPVTADPFVAENVDFTLVVLP